MIALVANGSVEAQEYAARALWHLASNPESQSAISDAGGVEPLVQMLSAEGQRAPELAALTIVRLAESNSQVSESISNVGGIVPLVKLLSLGSPEAQQQAASAIAELALVVQNRDAIADAMGIKPLIKLLSSDTPGTPESAARALSHLARDDGEKTDEIVEDESEEEGSEDDDKQADAGEKTVVEISPPSPTLPIDAVKVTRPEAPYIGGQMRRTMIADAGGIKKLIAMLDGNGINDAGEGTRSTAGQSWGGLRAVMVPNNPGEDGSEPPKLALKSRPPRPFAISLSVTRTYKMPSSWQVE